MNHAFKFTSKSRSGPPTTHLIMAPDEDTAWHLLLKTRYYEMYISVRPDEGIKRMKGRFRLVSGIETHNNVAGSDATRRANKRIARREKQNV